MYIFAYMHSLGAGHRLVSHEHVYDAMEDPEHAVNKRTRPYQWLRREATSNLRIMQALGRPCMTRQVLTPGQDEELLNESEEGDAGCRETAILWQELQQ